MVELSFLIMEQMTQRKYNNRLVNHFGFVKNQEKHRYVYILVKGGERKKIIKTLKHPSETYPKINDTDELEIHKLEPIESRG